MLLYYRLIYSYCLFIIYFKFPFFCIILKNIERVLSPVLDVDNKIKSSANITAFILSLPFKVTKSMLSLFTSSNKSLMYILNTVGLSAPSGSPCLTPFSRLKKLLICYLFYIFCIYFSKDLKNFPLILFNSSL